MARVIIPDMPPVPNGASEADRRKMFDDYMTQLVKYNPAYLNSDGSRKSLSGFLFEKVAPKPRKKP